MATPRATDVATASDGSAVAAPTDAAGLAVDSQKMQVETVHVNTAKEQVSSPPSIGAQHARIRFPWHSYAMFSPRAYGSDCCGIIDACPSLCLFVCIRCLQLCVHVSMYYMPASVCACLCVLHACICVCVLACIHACICVYCMSASACLYLCVSLCIEVYMYLC